MFGIHLIFIIHSKLFFICFRKHCASVAKFHKQILKKFNKSTYFYYIIVSKLIISVQKSIYKTFFFRLISLKLVDNGSYMFNLARLLTSAATNKCWRQLQIQHLFPVRSKCRDVDVPQPGLGKQYRRIVHYKDEYTVEPLETTHLAGRDPVSGRVVAKGIGGGIKHKFRWIKWIRDGPTDGTAQEERVIEILDDPCRTAKIALVAVGDEIKYILATENMKCGDILKTSRFIPRIPGKLVKYNFS